MKEKRATRNKPVPLTVPPTPGQVRAARLNADLTQAEAAAIVGKRLITWQRYEYGEIKIPYDTWEFFKLKTDQH